MKTEQIADLSPLPTDEYALQMLPKSRAPKVGQQAREMGIQIGDTIMGREGDEKYWADAELTLLCLSDDCAIWKVRKRSARNPEWRDQGEFGNWTLCCRQWHKVLFYKPQVIPNADQLGLGVRIRGDKPTVELLFEVADGAENSETGEPAPSGLRIIINLKSRDELKSVSHYENLAKEHAEQGILFGNPASIRVITWQEWLKYDDEEGGGDE